MSKRKIALFGGTFDPVHLGHITVAISAAESINAEKVIFIPAKHSALKEIPPVATHADRLEMLSLAIAKQEHFELSDYELKKTSPSYTLDTIRYFKTKYSHDFLIHWLVGADSVDDLPLWHKITKLIDECNLCVMLRADCAKPDFSKFTNLWGRERIEKLQNNIIQTPLINISSTEIRQKITAGKDVNDMLSGEVAQYIKRKGLYKSPSKT